MTFLKVLCVLMLTPALLRASEPILSAKSVQEFFDYLTAPGTNIGTDQAAQERWLMPTLRDSLSETIELVTKAQALPEMDGPDPALPDNGLFLDSWDLPTRCEVLNQTDISANSDVVMLCSWGPDTNYPGMSRKYSVAVVKQGEVYLVANMRAHSSKYASESEHLTRELEMLRDEARDWLTRKYANPSEMLRDIK